MVNQIFEQALRRRERHSYRAVRGFLRHSPAGGRLAPGAFSAADVVVRAHCFPLQDSGEDGHRREAHSAGRRDWLKSGDKRVDLRVSTVPTVYGEKIVMRILDKGAIPVELTGLGFDERQSKDLTESIQMPHGLMLVTGPTGSGKSTTLYACLNLLNEPDTNICTVEDPVEYKFKGINQVQVKAQVGLTFASPCGPFAAGPGRDHGGRGPRPGDGRDLSACRPDRPLRALHDPHQRFALRDKSSGGHGDRAVPAGVHAAGFRGAAARAPALQGLQGTLRVRRRDRQAHGLEVGQTIYRPKGCDECRNLGYKGRIGVFEVVRITPRMASLIQTRAALSELRCAANKA